MAYDHLEHHLIFEKICSYLDINDFENAFKWFKELANSAYERDKEEYPDFTPEKYKKKWIDQMCNLFKGMDNDPFFEYAKEKNNES